MHPRRVPGQPACPASDALGDAAGALGDPYPAPGLAFGDCLPVVLRCDGPSPTNRVGDVGQQEEGDEAEHQTGNDQQQEEDRRHLPMPRLSPATCHRKVRVGRPTERAAPCGRALSERLQGRPIVGYRRAVVVSLSPPHAAARDRRRGSPGPSPETCRGGARPTLRVAGSGRGPWLPVRRPASSRDRWTPQRSSWMRIRLPAGSRKAQSRMPYGCSVGSWTTSAPLASSRAKVPSRSLVARRIQP